MEKGGEEEATTTTVVGQHNNEVASRAYFGGNYKRGLIYSVLHEQDPLMLGAPRNVTSVHERTVSSWNMMWQTKTPAPGEQVDADHARHLLLSETMVSTAMMTMMPFRQYGIAVITSDTIRPQRSGRFSAGLGGWKRGSNENWTQQFYQSDLPLFKRTNTSAGLRAVIMPLVDGTHWSLLVQFRDPVSMRSNVLYHYDSASGMNLSVVKQVLDIYNTEGAFGKNTPPLFTESGNAEEVEIRSVTSLTQEGCWECGYFVLAIAKLILDRAISGIYTPLYETELREAFVDPTQLHIPIRSWLMGWTKLLVDTYDTRLYDLVKRSDSDDYARLSELPFVGMDVTQGEVVAMHRAHAITSHALEYLTLRVVPSFVHGSGGTYEVISTFESFLEEVRQASTDFASVEQDDQMLITFVAEKSPESYTSRYTMLVVYHQGAVYLYDISNESNVMHTQRLSGFNGAQLSTMFRLQGVRVVNVAFPEKARAVSRFESNVITFLLAERIIREHKPLVGSQFSNDFIDSVVNVISSGALLENVARYLMSVLVRDCAIIHHTEVPVVSVNQDQDWLFLLGRLETPRELIVSLGSEEWDEKRLLAKDRPNKVFKYAPLVDLIVYEDVADDETYMMDTFLASTDNPLFDALQMQPFNRSPVAKQDHLGLQSILCGMELDPSMHLYNQAKQQMQTMPYGLVSIRGADVRPGYKDIERLLMVDGARARSSASRVSPPVTPNSVYRSDVDQVVLKEHVPWHAVEPFIDPLFDLSVLAAQIAEAEEEEGEEEESSYKIPPKQRELGAKMQLVEQAKRALFKQLYKGDAKATTPEQKEKIEALLHRDTVDRVQQYQRMYRVFDLAAIQRIERTAFQQIVDSLWLKGDEAEEEATPSQRVFSILLRLPNIVYNRQTRTWKTLIGYETKGGAMRVVKELVDLVQQTIVDEASSIDQLTQVQEEMLYDALYEHVRFFPVSIVTPDALRVFSFTGLSSYFQHKIAIQWPPVTSDGAGEMHILSKAITSGNNTEEWYARTHVHSSSGGVLELDLGPVVSRQQFLTAMAYVRSRINALVFAQELTAVSEHIRVLNISVPDFKTIEILGV